MHEKKSVCIKARTTSAFKQTVEEYAKFHSTTTSTLIVSALQTYMKTEQNISGTFDDEYLYELKKNLFRNKVMNLINLEPNIPNHTKQKIAKELNNID